MKNLGKIDYKTSMNGLPKKDDFTDMFQLRRTDNRIS